MSWNNYHRLNQDSGGKPIRKKTSWILIGASLLVVSLLVAIILQGYPSLTDPEVSQSYRNDPLGAIIPGESVGQTFNIRSSNMDGITIWLEPSAENTEIILEVFSFSNDQDLVFSTRFPALRGRNRIEIKPPIPKTRSPLYIRLSVIQGEITVFGRLEDSYPEGSAYLDDSPIDSDLAFQTTYAYDSHAFLSDLKNIASEWRTLLALLTMLFIPGWLVLDTAGIRTKLDTGECVALSISLSLAIIPLLMLWTSCLHLQWVHPAIMVSAGILVAIFLCRITSINWQPKERLSKQGENRRFNTTSWILLAIFFVSLFIRMVMIRDLKVPPWVDSIHHALITQSIVQEGGYPEDYLPHIPLESRYYHPGYHSILATFHWFSGLEIPEAMLLLGQGLNAVTIFSVYALTKSLVKDKTTALVAAAVTGIFSVMPAYYTSWGRYTQLTGILILPTLPILNQKIFYINRKIPWIIVSGLSIGGLFMVHYRVAFFMSCLLLAFWVGTLFRRRPGYYEKLRSSFLHFFNSGLFGLVLTFPWFLPTLQNLFLPIAQAWGTGGNQDIPAIHWRYFTQASGIPVLVLAGLGLLVSIYKRKWFSITLLVWVGLLFLSANPGFFSLPFPAGFVNQTSIEIMMFIPISIFAGYFTSEVLSKINAWVKPEAQFAWKTAFMIIVIEASLLGGFYLLPTLNPETYFFRNEDYKAITWIHNHVPAGETLVINPVVWGYGLYRGEDGGYWISPITGHTTMPPNVLYGFNKEQRTQVNNFVKTLMSVHNNPYRIWKLLKEKEYQLIFIGTHGGILSPKTLAQSSLFEVQFNQGRTWVFRAIGIP